MQLDDLMISGDRTGRASNQEPGPSGPHRWVHFSDCLYVGDQDAYSRYQREVFLKDLANEQQMTDNMYQMSWDTWGPGWYR